MSMLRHTVGLGAAVTRRDDNLVSIRQERMRGRRFRSE
jgi:hypothetical protein